jgi:hypothetical protein
VCTSNAYQLLDPQSAVLAAAHQHRANIVRLPGRFSVLPDAPRPTLITFDNLPLSKVIPLVRSAVRRRSESFQDFQLDFARDAASQGLRKYATRVQDYGRPTFW